MEGMREGYKVVNRKSGWVLGSCAERPHGELYPSIEDVHRRIGKRYCKRVWRVVKGRWRSEDVRWLRDQ